MAEQRAPTSTGSSASDPSDTVWINGEPRELPRSCTIDRLLGLLEMGDRRVAVAVNRDVIARSAYTNTRLAAGDRVEILEAVGGG